MARAEHHVREILKLPPDDRARAARTRTRCSLGWTTSPPWRVLLDSLDEGGPSTEKLREPWTDWLARGPQGPRRGRRGERMAVIQRGDIRWFRFEHPDKRRPVLVLGRNDLLPAWSLVR